MTIFGSDVSHYDHTDTRAMFAQGVAFQTHKAGGDANDAELAGWWSLVRSYRPGVLLGAYWVLYPGNPVSKADAFLARLDSQCPGWRDGPFILQVDCEKWGGNTATVPTKADIQTFCDRLAAKMPRLRAIVYAPKWVYGNMLAGLDYPLWASSYVTATGSHRDLYPGDSSSRWAAYSGQTPAILQYTSSATIGGQTTCDANAFRGTLAELTALVAPGWKEDDMPLVDADIAKILGADKITNPRQRPDAATNPTTSWGFAVADTWAQIYNLRDAVAAQGKALTAAIQALAAKDQVDEKALAAVLVPGVVAAVLAGLPTGTDAISQDEVTTAVKAAFGDAFGHA